MRLPVGVPAHPRILAGRRFLRISPDISRNISGKRGVAGFPEIRFYLHKEFRAAGDPILSTQRIGGAIFGWGRYP